MALYRISDPTGPTANHLLSSVSLEDYGPLLPHLSPASLSLGEVLGDSQRHYGSAYFPTTAVLSLTCTMEDGASAEVALTGNDGLLPTALFLGGESTANRAVVGIAGEAFRMEARVLRDQFKRGGTFQSALLRYTEALITQISITAACNRVHTMEKRLCRWLLLARDRISSDEFFMTQEFVANMLGGRRETVTVAAGRLQDAGLIHYTRGRIRITDRKGLEQTACECYRAVSVECKRILAPNDQEVRHCIDENGLRTRASSSLS